MPAVNEADPRVKRTRKLLQDALLELLAEKSFDAITVQDIAERSTINRATFYAHFVDKYDLFASYNREWFRQALFNRLPEGAPFSRANLEAIIVAAMQARAAMENKWQPTDSSKPVVDAAGRRALR